jgi:hypothetical protein
MRLLLALLVCVSATKAGGQATPPQPDSLRVIIARLGTALTGVDAFADSMVIALRADSGTARADSSYFRLRDALQDRIDAAARVFNTMDFKVAVWPNGMAGVRSLQPVVSPPGQLTPDPIDADSVVSYLASHVVQAHVEEGDAYMSVHIGRLITRVGPFLTGAMRRYVELIRREQEQPCCGDAAIMISWDDLGDRAAAFDRFVVDHPNAAASAEASTKRRQYLGLLLTGSENTPAFSWKTKEMKPEVRASLARYAAKYQQLPSGRTMADYLALLKASGYRRTAAVTRFIRLHHGALIDD